MTKLVELSSTLHAQLKVLPDCETAFAETQQIMRLRVSETSKAATNFPVFFTRNSHDGNWVLSALTSFESNQCLFVKQGKWLATYQPTVLQTYPLFLMQSPKNIESYTIGVFEQSSAFSEHSGEDLFDDKGKASLYLSRIKTLLEADIKNDIQTYQFGKKLEQLGLLKAIDLLVHHEDGSVQTLSGLNTIDEDKLQALSAEQLHELNQQGYLVQIHAMLISIYQLNLLIRKHNEIQDSNKIAQLKVEIAKERAIT
ncbi:MAG: hypothetical protein ACJAV1_000753 [Paraglaciecola sp.]|jgi:hypothetical protein